MSVHPFLNVAAPVGTYTAAASSIAAWGLHVSDIAVILSSLAAVAGVSLQALIYREQMLTAHRLKASDQEIKDNASN